MISTVHDNTDDIAKLTFELGRCLRQKMLQNDDGKSLNMPQLHTLLFIQQKPGITMTELAAILRISSPSTTVFVDRLVKLKYVGRTHDDKNRRLVRLHITEAGDKSLRVAMIQKRKVMASILNILSPEDQQALKRILKTILLHCS
jgi:DNA-binding MarR family transcriptional regulator